MRTTLKQTLATMAALGALLMLCTTACTQHADLPLPNGTPAQGGEPLMLSVAPKQAFAQADADANNPHTRATVDTDGTNFAWRVDDVIYVNYFFDDKARTAVYHRWVYTGTGASDQSYLTNWNTYAGWADNGAAAPTITYPVGATSCSMNAFYTDCKRTASHDANNATRPWSIVLDYTNATGDRMLFDDVIEKADMGTPLNVKMSHEGTRVRFTGLTPNQAYSLRAKGTALQYPAIYPSTDTDNKPQTFTTDDQGNLVVCSYLNNLLDDATHKLTLDVMTGGTLATDACISTVELTGKQIGTDYTLSGYQYAVDVKSYAGDNDPDHIPNLLPPLPITPGNKVYSVNGYWVTAPNANESKDYTWETAKTACAIAQGWRMPTMKDFEVMGGFPEFVGTPTSGMTITNDIFKEAFPAAYYLSSNEETTFTWCLHHKPTGDANYARLTHGNNVPVRCVQKQKP